MSNTLDGYSDTSKFIGLSLKVRSAVMTRKESPGALIGLACRYDVDTQLRVIYSCFALHNFIMLYGKEEDDIQVDDDVDDGPDDENQRVARAYEENDRGRAEMERKHDKIAERFWVEYEEVQTQRSRR